MYQREVFNAQKKRKRLGILHSPSFGETASLFQASYEPAVSPVRLPVRIPSAEFVTPPPSASDVERKIKDGVSSHNEYIFVV